MPHTDDARKSWTPGTYAAPVNLGHPHKSNNKIKLKNSKPKGSAHRRSTWGYLHPLGGAEAAGPRLVACDSRGLMRAQALGPARAGQPPLTPRAVRASAHVRHTLPAMTLTSAVRMRKAVGSQDAFANIRARSSYSRKAMPRQQGSFPITIIIRSANTKPPHRNRPHSVFNLKYECL